MKTSEVRRLIKEMKQIPIGGSGLLMVVSILPEPQQYISRFRLVDRYNEDTFYSFYSMFTCSDVLLEDYNERLFSKAYRSCFSDYCLSLDKLANYMYIHDRSSDLKAHLITTWNYCDDEVKL